MTKDVTVVIPAFNSQATISDAINSAKCPSVAKILVIDDGSSDSTAEYARVAGAEVKSIENGGAAKARQYGLGFAQTDFVLFLDADDILFERPFEVLAAEFRTLASAAIGVIGAYESKLPSGAIEVRHPWAQTITLEGLLKKGFACGPPGCALWTREALLKSYSMQPKALNPRYAEDFETLVRLSMNGEIVTSSQIVCQYAEGTGKSAKFPKRSIASANETRIYYSAHVGFTLKPWSRADICALAIQRLSHARMRTNRLAGFALLAVSICISPIFAFSRLRGKSFG